MQINWSKKEKDEQDEKFKSLGSKVILYMIKLQKLHFFLEHFLVDFLAHFFGAAFLAAFLGAALALATFLVTLAFGAAKVNTRFCKYTVNV